MKTGYLNNIYFQRETLYGQLKLYHIDLYIIPKIKVIILFFQDEFNL